MTDLILTSLLIQNPTYEKSGQDRPAYDKSSYDSRAYDESAYDKCASDKPADDDTWLWQILTNLRMTKCAYDEIWSVMTSACSSHVANLKFSKKHASEQVWLTFDVCGTFSLPFADQLLIYGTLPLGSVLPVVLSC